MQSMDRFHAIELQQHECSCESQLSPGVFVLNLPTSSEHRRAAALVADRSLQSMYAQRLSQIWRKRSYVRHGVSPTTDVYQSSWSVAHTVALCALAPRVAASTPSARET
jgi:hypothetical protein